MSGEVYSEDELIAELHRLDSERGKVTADTVREHSDISLTPFKERFGSWNEAKEVAGLDTNHQFHREPENGIRGRVYARHILEWASCERCGLDEDACIEFHHVKEKIFHIGKVRHESQRYGSTRVYEELQKTVPLCGNCHNRHHSDLHGFVATEELIPNYPEPSSIKT